MTKDEALKLALEALKTIDEAMPFPVAKLAQKAIKEALAQPKQEPVAFASHGVVNWIADKQFQHEADLYTAPQRTWVGLTDEEIGEIAVKSQDGISPHDDTLRFARAIEAALRSKNT